MIGGLRWRIGTHACGSSILRFRSSQFVPEHSPVQEEDIQRLEDFLHDKPNILVLTGAGISTESGGYFRVVIIRPTEPQSNIFRSSGLPVQGRRNVCPEQESAHTVS